ncbi:germination protein YpeB [Candidatus Formimonas warabiya]|uniref:Germination protein YpeB n=1 Tax=Formimonas warabiya TaxID=1761012 RepID=A0A3G1KN83_FORW1|nr:germination protein YpeB [Candidatus Formimonas warabiya]ATW23886.1 germination protein YpeB [Candidatus Formimonas warabiya]
MRNWLTGILAAALIVSGVWGFSQYRMNQANRILLENDHQRSFYNLVDNVENLSVLTSKSIVSGSPQQNIRLLSDIWWQANFAQDNLAQLPLSHVTLTRTQKFLTQLGDYAYSLAKNTADGRPMNAKQTATLQDLHNQISRLSGDLIELQNEVVKNGVNWREVKNTSKEKLDKESTGYLDTNFQKMNEQINQYPTLIYDGPFSDHLETKNPKALTGKAITWEEAKKRARDFVDLRDRIDYVVADNGKSTAKASIPVYSVRISPRVPSLGEVIYVDVSQKGGHITMAMNSRSIGAATIGIDQALEKAKAFLAKTEYQSMVPTYSLRQENTLIVSFAYKENDVIVYPDLVKVSVAMDNGQVTGFESLGYLMQHHQRNLPEPKLTLEEARKKLNKVIKVDSERLTLIPLETGEEVLCYEFKGSYKSDNFLIYINALDGTEEQILQLLHTPGGTWTM